MHTKCIHPQNTCLCTCICIIGKLTLQSVTKHSEKYKLYVQFQTPPTPKGNYFEVGMKLEAVDKKNPDYICPVTIAEVKGDQILLTFDGWLDSFNYWCRYDSRDIFPIGWCKQSGLFVQPPGKKGKYFKFTHEYAQASLS